MKLLNKKTPMSTRPVFSKKTGLRSQLAGFTLVELIVVISILAIL
jgi:prepilin-type N-terminal cleavage/methylation domain-containing protein